MFQNIRTIFFDFDGTLHNSINIYAPAFTKAFAYLVDHGYVEARSWREDEISHWLGFNPVNMWKSFMPDLGADITAIASKIIGDEMIHQIQNGHGALYPGTLEVLKYLKDKAYTLVFLSNCGASYKNIVKEQFHLDHYFDSMICSGEYHHIPKYEILHQIKSNYQNNMVIVGDRFHDIDAGLKNHIYTIGCAYGYCKEKELDHSHCIIHDISQITNLL